MRIDLIEYRLTGNGDLGDTVYLIPIFGTGKLNLWNTRKNLASTALENLVI